MYSINLFVIDIHNIRCLEPFLSLYGQGEIRRFLGISWQYKLKPCRTKLKKLKPTTQPCAYDSGYLRQLPRQQLVIGGSKPARPSQQNLSHDRSTQRACSGSDLYYMIYNGLMTRHCRFQAEKGCAVKQQPLPASPNPTR